MVRDRPFQIQALIMTDTGSPLQAGRRQGAEPSFGFPVPLEFAIAAFMQARPAETGLP